VEDGSLVIELGEPKKGNATVGVTRQLVRPTRQAGQLRCRCLRRYVGKDDSTALVADLFLPKEWRGHGATRQVYVR